MTIDLIGNPSSDPMQDGDGSIRVAYILGDMRLDVDEKHPNSPRDLQLTAFRTAIRSAVKALTNSNRRVTGLHAVFDEVGPWQKRFVDESVIASLFNGKNQRKRCARSPRLSYLLPKFRDELVPHAIDVGLEDPSLIQFLPGQKLKDLQVARIMRRLERGDDISSLRRDDIWGFGEEGEVITPCPGVATSLFLTVADVPLFGWEEMSDEEIGSRRKKMPHVVKAYFVETPVITSQSGVVFQRVDRGKISRGIMAAQALFGLEAEVKLFWFSPCHTDGSPISNHDIDKSPTTGWLYDFKGGVQVGEEHIGLFPPPVLR